MLSTSLVSAPELAGAGGGFLSPPRLAPPVIAFPRKRARGHAAPGRIAKRKPYPVLEARAEGGRFFTGDGTPQEHINLLHGPGSGAACLGLRRMTLLPAKDTGHREPGSALAITKQGRSGAMALAPTLVDESNVFITQADYYWGARADPARHKQTRDYARSIGVLYLDLDCYHAEIADICQGSAEKLSLAVRKQCETFGVPEPIVIFSGRGLYTLWPLRQRVDLFDSQAVARWTDTQARLMSVFREFHPDPVVKDVTRVLRLVGTTNGKVGKRVRVLHDPGQRYFIDELARAVAHRPLYEPPEKPTRKPPPRHTASSKTAGKRPPVETGATSRDAPPPPTPATSCEAPPPHVVAALDWLQARVTYTRGMLENLPAWRARHWHIFSDIATLIARRGGIATGMRDQTLFWLLTAWYQTGAFHAHELPFLAEQVANLCQEPLNLWENGFLCALHARMVKQDALSAGRRFEPDPPSSGTIRTVRDRRAPDGEPVAWGHGQGYQRPCVYTPKRLTLIEKLSITTQEQHEMVWLIDDEERLRRLRLQAGPSRSQQRTQRDTRIRQAFSEGQRAENLARRHRLSRASVYRITSQAASSPRRARHADTTRELAWRIHLGDPSISLRTLSELTGASRSSLHRWFAQPAPRAARRELTQRCLVRRSDTDSWNSRNLANLSWGGTLAAAASIPTTTISEVIDSSHLLFSTEPVPLSHLSPLSSGGERRGERGEKTSGTPCSTPAPCGGASGLPRETPSMRGASDRQGACPPAVAVSPELPITASAAHPSTGFSHSIAMPTTPPIVIPPRPPQARQARAGAKPAPVAAGRIRPVPAVTLATRVIGPPHPTPPARPGPVSAPVAQGEADADSKAIATAPGGSGSVVVRTAPMPQPGTRVSSDLEESPFMDIDGAPARPLSEMALAQWLAQEPFPAQESAQPDPDPAQDPNRDPDTEQAEQWVRQVLEQAQRTSLGATAQKALARLLEEALSMLRTGGPHGAWHTGRLGQRIKLLPPAARVLASEALEGLEAFHAGSETPRDKTGAQPSVRPGNR